jgi:hypothetical protein
MPPNQSPPPPPPRSPSRKRRRTPSRDPGTVPPDKKQQRRRRSTTQALDRHLRRCVRLLQSKGGLWCDPNTYHASRRICYLPDQGIGLFARYDPLNRRTQVSWERCQYTLGRKVQIACDHVEGCNGFAKDKPFSLMGRFLRLCECPDKVVVNDYVWLVDPKETEVEHVDQEGRVLSVRHGNAVQR